MFHPTAPLNPPGPLSFTPARSAEALAADQQTHPHAAPQQQHFTLTHSAPTNEGQLQETHTHQHTLCRLCPVLRGGADVHPQPPQGPSLIHDFSLKPREVRSRKQALHCIYKLCNHKKAQLWSGIWTFIPWHHSVLSRGVKKYQYCNLLWYYDLWYNINILFS